MKTSVRSRRAASPRRPWTVFSGPFKERAILAVASAIALVATGCGVTGGGSGPDSTDVTSDGFVLLQDKIDFLKEYLTIEWECTALEFDVLYFNGGRGLVPGPSYWDIRFVAVMPELDIARWMDDLTEVTGVPSPEWLEDVPGQDGSLQISEWYADTNWPHFDVEDHPGVLLGVDRATKTIIMRYWNP